MVTSTKIAIAAAIAVCCAFVTAYARPHSAPMRNFNERHFDHAAHAKAVTAKGTAVPACAHCHPTDPKAPASSKLLDNDDAYSVQDHAFCSGSGCHATKDNKFGDTTKCTDLDARDQAKVCVLCHVTKCGAVMPPNDGLASRFAHGRHSDNASITSQCVLCHKAEAQIAAPSNVTAHESCSAGNCHGSSAKPGMTDCASCHTGPTAKSAKSPFRVAFVHGTHAKASGETHCTACHRKPNSTAADAVLIPQMLDCQNACHNGAPRVGGKPVFATVGTHCTKCHVGTDQPIKASTELTFSHAGHEKRNVKISDCASCHTVEPDGGLAGPGMGKDHQPCATSGCHQTEFASKQTKICGVCHEQTAPWVKNQSRPGPILTHEWFQGMNHLAHLKTAGTTNAACDSCHGDKLTNATAPRGHKPCAQCHAKGQAPAMTECAACHSRTAPAHAPVSQWAVTGNFKHQSHAMDPRSNKITSCIECHGSISTAKDLTTAVLPAMSQCEGCHDGKKVANGKPIFKTTGFECARCHQKNDAAPKATSELLVPRPAPVASIP